MAARKSSLSKEAVAKIDAGSPAPHPAKAPFQRGDVVRLKSGGHGMTVENISATCAPDFFVEVIWSADRAWSELKRETLPSPCLVRSTDLDDSIPF